MVSLVRQLYKFNPHFEESIEFSFITLHCKDQRFKNNTVNVLDVTDTELPSTEEQRKENNYVPIDW